jgi:ABC-type transport system involved in multi-copper enzyme maturation permease subunit
MWVEMASTLKRSRGLILGWGLGLALYSLLMVSMYGDIRGIDFSAFFQYYPQELMAFFGDSMLAISTPYGYLDLYFFNYMSVIVGILAAGMGARLIVKDEEDGLLDLVLAYPKSRSAIFWGRVLGLILTLALIMAISWLSWVLPAGRAGLDLTPGELLRPFWGLLGQLLLFGCLALMLSMILPASRLASMVVGGLLVANYLMVGLAHINKDLEQIVKVTPLHLYQGGYAIQGVDGEGLLIVLELIVLFCLLAWWRFLERDLRVAGEGGWKLQDIIPGWGKKAGQR